ncbi:MAG: tyrosine-type recombinase/integrase [Acidobacteriota bacterium]|jgi:integrase/recombinase XerD
MKPISQSLEEYLALRRRLGFKLKQDGRLLAQFVSFLGEEGNSHITTELALRWAVKPDNAQRCHWARRLSMVRLFAEYRKATDSKTEIPPPKLLPETYRRTPPYIYTDEQIIHLITAAEELPSTVPGTTGLRARTYYTLIGLLSVTGMRISEALSLNREDVDLNQALLTVRGTKFDKSRLIPIHKSTQEALQQYAHLRDRIYPEPEARTFLVSERGTKLGYSGVRSTFIRLSREIGLRGLSYNHGPRMHDLRHRFAVSTMINWYREGVGDIERRLYVLSTFLGHVKASYTYWYLTAVPELLQLAVERLEGIGEDYYHEDSL